MINIARQAATITLAVTLLVPVAGADALPALVAELMIRVDAVPPSYGSAE